MTYTESTEDIPLSRGSAASMAIPKFPSDKTAQEEINEKEMMETIRLNEAKQLETRDEKSFAKIDSSLTTGAKCESRLNKEPYSLAPRRKKPDNAVFHIVPVASKTVFDNNRPVSAQFPFEDGKQSSETSSEGREMVVYNPNTHLGLKPPELLKPNPFQTTVSNYWRTIPNWDNTEEIMTKYQRATSAPASLSNRVENYQMKLDTLHAIRLQSNGGKDRTFERPQKKHFPEKSNSFIFDPPRVSNPREKSSREFISLEGKELKRRKNFTSKNETQIFLY